MPRPRPADFKAAGEDYSLFQGEPLVMDLRFTPAAALRGRIVDERGHPVSGAKIELGHCDYLDTKHKESHHNFREFWALGHAPSALRTANTGPDGRFRLEGLPSEAGFRVYVEHPDYAWLSLFAATTARPATAFDYPLGRISSNERPAVKTGDLELTLQSTRSIVIRSVFASTGLPAQRVRVFASQGSSENGSGASGETDAEGNLVFRLPAGEYNVTLDPAAGDGVGVRTRSKFSVAHIPAQQSVELRLNQGCILVLQAVDAKTGLGIPGVVFLREIGRNRGRQPVQTRTHYVDHPRSDASGQVRAVVDPGEGVFSIGQVPESSGYRESVEQKRVVLFAGETVTVRFQLDK
jgi:hypothetical protein